MDDLSEFVVISKDKYTIKLYKDMACSPNWWIPIVSHPFISLVIITFIINGAFFLIFNPLFSVIIINSILTFLLMFFIMGFIDACMPTGCGVRIVLYKESASFVKASIYYRLSNDAKYDSKRVNKYVDRLKKYMDKCILEDEQSSIQASLNHKKKVSYEEQCDALYKNIVSLVKKE